MNRVLTALALSGLFVAAPAFGKTSQRVAKAPVAGDKSTDTKPADGSTAAPAGDSAAKPVKAKKSKKSKTAEPAAAPTEGAPSK
jgi:hypothetical protein